ncbi:MAG TPA: nucleotidyltransferase family protein [Chloroflexota bacterium]|nr:nucleotidyltransferase family protein [Chloroflexota bacterium]
MIAGIVLAAGESKRMGRPKQLMRVGQTTLLNRVVDAALESKLDAVYVVLGHLANQVEASLRQRDRVSVVLNPDYAEGLGSSVRAGVAALPPEADAAMFLLGDQPFLPVGLLNQLIAKSTPENIVAPLVDGERKNPTIFARAFFSELLHVTGDSGGRTVIQAHPEALVLVETSEPLLDDDTPEDAAALFS